VQQNSYIKKRAIKNDCAVLKLSNKTINRKPPTINPLLSP